MRDRGGERRAEMVGWVIGGLSAVLTVSILGGAVVVIVHFICKFW